MELSAQVHITMQLDGIAVNEVYFGKMFGKRTKPEQTISRNNEGLFVLDLSQTPPPGMYAIIYHTEHSRSNLSFQLIIEPGINKYSLRCEANAPHHTMTVTGSEELTIYNEYYKAWDRVTSPYQSFTEEWRMRQDEKSFDNLVNMEQSIAELQQRYLEQHPNSLTAQIIRQTPMIIPSKGSTLTEKAAIRQAYFSQELPVSDIANNTLFWDCPLHISWLDIHAVRSPDLDLDQAYDRILNILKALEPYKEGYDYYTLYLINTFRAKNRNDFDQIFVKLVNDFVKTGKAAFMDEETVERNIDQADKITRLSPGQLAPDITLYDRDENPVTLSEIPNQYILVMFWNPDCSSCRRELPILKKLLDQHRDKDIKLITVCGKRNQYTASCYEYLDEHFPDNNWLNLSDPLNKSSVNTVYYVPSTPTNFLIDKDRKILMRRQGSIPEYELNQRFKALKSRW